jgi:hypothetical protein
LTLVLNNCFILANWAELGSRVGSEDELGFEEWRGPDTLPKIQ